MDNIHSSRNFRNVSFILDQDENGLYTGDVIQVKIWNSFSPNLAKGRMGPCSVTINLYRVHSTAVINGPDAPALYDERRKLLQAINFSPDIQ